jgi:hypothetical protein
MATKRRRRGNQRARARRAQIRVARARRALAVGAPLLLTCGLGAALLVGSLQASVSSADAACRLVVPADGAVELPVLLDGEQLDNAAAVVGASEGLGLPRRAAVIAVATALQESSLRVLDQEQSDRDSAGLFQQRPSQGWGSVEQVMDRTYAAERFLEELVRIPGWRRLPLTVVAQQVQRSAYPGAYARWEPTAVALVDALAAGAEVSCEPLDG